MCTSVRELWEREKGCTVGVRVGKIGCASTEPVCLVDICKVASESGSGPGCPNGETGAMGTEGGWTGVQAPVAM